MEHEHLAGGGARQRLHPVVLRVEVAQGRAGELPGDAYLGGLGVLVYGEAGPVVPGAVDHRAGGGVRTFKIAKETGEVAAARVVSLSEQVMIISAEGIVTRTPVKEKDPRQGITTQGRSTQGVRLMKLDAGDEVVAVASFVGEKDKTSDIDEKEGK